MNPLKAGSGESHSSSPARRALRVVLGNAALLLAGVGAIGVGYEAWFRMTTPIMHRHKDTEFVPGVGRHVVPHSEVRWTNGLDFWTVAEANSLGFVDREPPGLERIAASCHIAFVGDSFVEAAEVDIADKLPVLLEDLAAQRLAHMDVTTSAFGKGSTGQVAQLPYYDTWIRRMRPKLVVLVFVNNDFSNNTGRDLESGGIDLRRPPFAIAFKKDDGRIALRPPSPDWRAHRVRRSKLTKFHLLNSCHMRPLCSRLLHFAGYRGMFGLAADVPPKRPATALELEFTAFALDEWRRRAESDGIALAVLTSYTVGTHGYPLFDAVSRFAEARNMPVIDQFGYILRQGARIEDARWKHDLHWSPRGHQWAAEAMLEWLEANPSVCDR